MSRHTASIERAYFDKLYAADPDPWGFATRFYEHEKYAASLAALPQRHFEAAVEIGCSIGIFTAELGKICGSVLAVDVAEAALAVARQNCAAANVTFENRRVPEDWPSGCFDLIVFSEVLYYLDKNTIGEVAHRATAALRPGGVILLVHYLGETDYPVSGDDAASHFMSVASLNPLSQSRAPLYRIDVLNHTDNN